MKWKKLSLLPWPTYRQLVHHQDKLTHIWGQHFGQAELPLPPGSDLTELWVRWMPTRPGAPGPWGATASSSCPTAPSSPHASARQTFFLSILTLGTAHPTKSLSKTQSPPLCCKRILLHDALPLYAFYSLSMALRLVELLVQTSLFSPHGLPFCRTAALSSSSVPWLFQPKFPALHLPLTLVCFFQSVSAMCWTHFNSHPVAVPSSLETSVNLSSILTTYSTIQAANKSGEQNLLPSSSLYSLPPPVKLRVYRGVSPQRGGVADSPDFCRPCHISQQGQRTSKAAMLILRLLPRALQTLPGVCFIVLQLWPAGHYTTKERRKE